MFVYLWNLCKFVLLKITAISWNLIKRVQGEQQQQVNNTAKGEQQPEPQNTTAKGKVDMAVEVWTDVLGFVERLKLARTVSLTNRQIHQICWPRLHGNKVMPHQVPEMIIASQDDDPSPTAILLRERTKLVPFANCPPPDYITGFRHIQINFMDDQVLAFIKVIAPHLTELRIFISSVMANLDDQKRGFITQMLELFREKLYSICTNLDNIQFLQDVDNKTRQIELSLNAATDIPLLMNWLATPRSDGKQRVIWLSVEDQLGIEMVDAIKQDFRTCTRTLPQPFYILCHIDHPNLNIPSEEENAQTKETLTIQPDGQGFSGIEIFRHPTGEHGKWAEDAHGRIDLLMNGSRTFIGINHMWISIHCIRCWLLHCLLRVIHFRLLLNRFHKFNYISFFYSFSSSYSSSSSFFTFFSSSFTFSSIFYSRTPNSTSNSATGSVSYFYLSHQICLWQFVTYDIFLPLMVLAYSLSSRSINRLSQFSFTWLMHIITMAFACIIHN